MSPCALKGQHTPFDIALPCRVTHVTLPLVQACPLLTVAIGTLGWFCLKKG